MSITDVEIGGAIRTRRIAHGKTEAALAKRLGMTIAELRARRRGIAVSASEIHQACKALDLSPTFRT
jgi:transcriptional regulator with XRE-family HTH domain